MLRGFVAQHMLHVRPNMSEWRRIVLTFHQRVPRLARIIRNSVERNVCCTSRHCLTSESGLILTMGSEHRSLYAESAKVHRGTLDCNVRSLALFANTILLLALRVAFACMVFVGTNQFHNHWNRSGQARIGCRRR